MTEAIVRCESQIPLSSPGLTGRSSTPRPIVSLTSSGDYWMLAFAGMTAGMSGRVPPALLERSHV
jgi:hypothetical protein